jgi:hypothetical protein
MLLKQEAIAKKKARDQRTFQSHRSENISPCTGTMKNLIIVMLADILVQK